VEEPPIPADQTRWGRFDPHSPGKFRMEGGVGNMPEFAQAFGGKAGQPMARQNTGRAW
jgi:predicted metalloendopeptidase